MKITPNLLLSSALMFSTVLLDSAASAQTNTQVPTWTTSDGNFSYVLNGCARLQNNDVQCNASVTALDVDRSSVDFYFNDFTSVGPDGTAYAPTLIRAGQGYPVNTGYNGVHPAMYKGLPVTITVNFSYPTTLNSVSRLKFDGKVLADVPIRAQNASQTGRAVTPAPVTTTTSTAATSRTPTGFNISLSNCAVNVGVYTCTATLTAK